MLIMSKFRQVLPDDLPRIPPYREIKFVIDLILDTKLVSKTSYKITLIKLKELKDVIVRAS